MNLCSPPLNIYSSPVNSCSQPINITIHITKIHPLLIPPNKITVINPKSIEFRQRVCIKDVKSVCISNTFVYLCKIKCTQL